MKKSIIATLLASTAALAASEAHADSTLTLYGIVNGGLSYMTTKAGSNFGTAYGNLSGNRWGLRGAEDLGGGLKAVFRLENGFSVINGKLGQGSREFGRSAYVGLSSTDWGTVTIGRQYDPLVDMTQGLTAETWGSSIFATAGDVDNNDDSSRINNSVKYVSRSYSGLTFEGMYALGGVAGANGQGYTASGAVSYAYGGLTVAGGYFQATNNNVAIGKRSSWTSGSMDSLFDGGSINAGYASAHMIGITQVAAQYIIAKLKVGLGYSNAQYKADGQSTFKSTEQYNTGRAFGFYQVTPAFALAANYAYTHASGDASATYHQITAASFYSLSKATDLYFEAAYQRASGTQRLASGGLQSALASISSYGVDGTRGQGLVIAGMRHRF